MATIYPSDNPPPSAEERYTGATNTSNLKVEARRQLPADYLIAAGWSPSRLGAALLRLHSEWDGSEKPRRPTKERIDQIAEGLPRLVEGKRQALDIPGARRQAHDWYMHELKILFQKLKTMPEVRLQLAIWVYQCGIEEPEHRAAEILSWWLDHTCPVCHGRGKQLIHGSPIKSHRNCPECKGSGQTPVPFSHDDRNYVRESHHMLDHIGRCVTEARASLKQRLQHGRAKKGPESA